MWRRSIAYANDPEKLFERFRHQVEATYANRKVTPAKGKLTWNNLRGGAVMAWRIVLHLCLLSDFRKPFWRMAKHALKHGQIDGMMGAAFMGYHLIEFTREALRGDQNASYYSAKKRAAPMAVAKPPARERRERRGVAARQITEHRHAPAVVGHQRAWRFRWPATTAIACGNSWRKSPSACSRRMTASDIRSRPMAAFVRRDDERDLFPRRRGAPQGRRDRAQSQRGPGRSRTDRSSSRSPAMPRSRTTGARSRSCGDRRPRPGGDSPDDPNIRLLTVTPDDAEFWDGPGKIVGTIKMLAAAATHTRPNYGDNRKVTM